MKLFFVCFIGLPKLIISNLSQEKLHLNKEEHLQSFNSFTSKFGKVYDTSEEYDQRFQIFSENLKEYVQMNEQERANGGTAIYGPNRFSDLSKEEIRRYYGYSKKTATVQSNPIKLSAQSVLTRDWTGIYTTPVKDQGSCGSCWAFSSAEQIESDAIRTIPGWPITKLSPQQIVSCDTVDGGCNGGDTLTAYDYVKSFGGLQKESDYPYTSGPGSTGTCSAVKSKVAIGLTAYYSVGDTTKQSTTDIEAAMKTYILNIGPLSVCLSATDWSGYSGGIKTTCSTTIDHCVQLVGYNTTASTGPYWILRNQWNTDWGVKGFMYLKYGSNLCQITSEATYTQVFAINPVGTNYPTKMPAKIPSSTPTRKPSSTPTSRPTSAPTATPSSIPTSRPSSTPTKSPTSIPTSRPSSTPTKSPTSIPTSWPTSTPTKSPSSTPMATPSSTPASIPAATPTSTPNSVPTSTPSSTPTSRIPTKVPSANPTATKGPTQTPSSRTPTYLPSRNPSPKPVTMQCNVPYPSYIGDGDCDSGVYNSAGCNYDGGDCCMQSCITTDWTCGHSGYSCKDPRYLPTAKPTPAPILPTNKPTSAPFSTSKPTPTRTPTEFPTLSSVSCPAVLTGSIGDGWCDADTATTNRAECNYDGGDCCIITCQSSKYNCGTATYVCVNPRYAGVPVSLPTMAPVTSWPTQTPSKPVKPSATPSMSPVNFPVTSSPTKAPVPLSNLPTRAPVKCDVMEPTFVGDGWCDGGDYNTAGCGWDGGDCCKASCLAAAATAPPAVQDERFDCGRGGYECLDPTYNTAKPTKTSTGRPR